MGASGTEKLDCVEAVQLRGLRVRHIENDGVEFGGGGLEIVTAIGVVDVNARVGIRRLRGKELPGHADERGVELDVIEPLLTPPPMRRTFRGAGCSSNA